MTRKDTWQIKIPVTKPDIKKKKAFENKQKDIEGKKAQKERAVRKADKMAMIDEEHNFTGTQEERDVEDYGLPTTTILLQGGIRSTLQKYAAEYEATDKKVQLAQAPTDEINNTQWTNHTPANHQHMSWKEITQGRGETDAHTVYTEAHDIWNGLGLKHFGITLKYVRTNKHHVLVVNPEGSLTHIRKYPDETFLNCRHKELTHTSIEQIEETLKEKVFDKDHINLYTSPCTRLKDLRLLTWSHAYRGMECLRKWVYAFHMSLQHSMDSATTLLGEAVFRLKGYNESYITFLIPYHLTLFLTVSLFAKNPAFPGIRKAFS